MKSVTRPPFWKRFALLNQQNQTLARKAFHQFVQNPDHPGLNFKHLRGLDNHWSVRVGEHCRAVCLREGDKVTWIWIGTHSEFDKLF